MKRFALLVLACVLAITGCRDSAPVRAEAGSRIERSGAVSGGSVPVAAIQRPTDGGVQSICGSPGSAPYWGSCGGGSSSSLNGLPTVWLISGTQQTFGSGGTWVNQGSAHDTWTIPSATGYVSSTTLNGKPATLFSQTSGGSNSSTFQSPGNSLTYVTQTAWTVGIAFQYADTNTGTQQVYASSLLSDSNLYWGAYVTKSSTSLGGFAAINQSGTSGGHSTFPTVLTPAGSLAIPHYLIARFSNGVLTTQIDGSEYVTNPGVSPMSASSSGLVVGVNGVSNLGQFGGSIAEVIVYPYAYDLNQLGTYLGTKYSLPLPTQPTFGAYYGVDGGGVSVNGGAIALANPNGDAGCQLTKVGSAVSCLQPTGQILSCVGTGSTTCSITGTALHVASTAADAGSGGSAAWVVDEDCDLTAQTTQALMTDGNYTFCSQTWTKGNSANEATHAVITNGTGLVLTPSSATNIAGSTWTAPYLHIPFSSYVTGLTATTPVRASIWVSSDNAAANDDSTLWGLEIGMPTISSTYGYNDEGVFGYSGGTHGWALQASQGGINTIDSFAAPPATNRVGVLTFPAGLVAGVQTVMSGTTYTGGAWPSAGTLDLAAGPGQIAVVSSSHLELANATTGALGVSGLHFFIAAMRNGSSTSYVTTIARVRIEHLPPTN